ncbi:hypothetical protein [Flavobacterium cerinum]|uniref:Uncharacterized protein n=1 Tax=Flavobacterium cerinum TaxID=2502784 RepID=A0ABY5IUZ4_9FLAO|nr:hypothetical protein [Flavobacterium cerinum]UUC45154.1 hypothetical protein NOX80_16205 [Flavobacterium cerinum]
MSNTSRLFVPMYMEALALGSDKNDCMDLGPQLQQYNQSILGNVLQPDTNKTIQLKKGVHLHWTLPKALKHAFINEGEEMQFPFTPNRWMVIRIRTDKGIKNMESRMWIVKSDEKNTIKNNKPVPNWITVQNDKLDFSNLGKVVEWSAAYEDSVTSPVLTGVGAVNPYFASLYHSSKNVYGFHDDMADINSDCTVTYVVTGWYNDPASDPLAPFDFDEVKATVAQVRQKRTQDWFKQQWKCDQETYPESCLLHASIHSIQWNSALKSGVPEGEVQVYVGNTAIESLSAQIIKSNTIEKPGVEELLNALQYQFLDDSKNEPGLKSIQTEIHKRGFTPKNRSSIWEISRVEATDTALEEKQDERPHFPENNAILKELNTLNETQINCNKIKQEIVSLQQEYYFLWYKQAYKTVNNYTVQNFDYDASRQIILDQLVAKKVEVNLLDGEIQQRTSDLRQYKELAGANPEYELKEVLEDRFWEPNDPVVLFCGSGIGNTEKPAFQATDKEINCRLEEQLLTKLYLNVPYNTTTIPVTISASQMNIPAVNALQHPKIPFAAIKALVSETLLLDHSLSIDIALQAYIDAQLGDGKDKTSAVIKDFAQKVREIQSEPDYKDKEKAHESFSITRWEQAWTPLFMVWDIVYTSNNPDIKNLDLLADSTGWKLEEGLYFKKQAAKVEGTPVSISGISPFSNSVFANLKKTVPEAIVDKYGKLNLIAQALSGLHKNLLMQRTDIQLPPFLYSSDPDYNFNTEYQIDRNELNVISEDGYKLGCDPGNINGTDATVFNPLRSGALKIKSLSIVDAFGQVKKVIVEDDTNITNIACSVTLQGDEKESGVIIPLPPRIIQPSRLQFNWLNTDDNIIYQDTGKTDSPVLGWLVPNYLDNSILVYDGDGNEIVVLQIVSDLTKNKGLKLIKQPFPGGNTIPELTTNPQLKKLLETINSGSKASGIMDLAYKVSLNATGNTALQNTTSALLYGQPLALVRCSVGLESLGLPCYDQRWSQSGKEDTGNIETVKFPLTIGDYEMEKNGVIGYFADTESEVFHTVTNAPEFNFSDSDSFFAKNTALKLNLNQEPVKVTLLLYPSAGVHLATGILPTKFVELFNHNSGRLLSQLDIGFRVAPFIAEKVAPDIPIPAGINANWKWTHKSDVTTWQSDEALAEGKNKQISGFKKQQVYEGWLRLSNLKTNN